MSVDYYTDLVKDMKIGGCHQFSKRHQNPILRFGRAEAGAMSCRMARLLLKTLESMATPCSAKAQGVLLRTLPQLEVTNCDLKDFALINWDARAKAFGSQQK
jgi:hypothetical protein